jgi:hypothetical protein
MEFGEQLLLALQGSFSSLSSLISLTLIMEGLRGGTTV